MLVGSLQVANGRLSVSSHLSGGVCVGLLGASFVLSPHDAVAFAEALLKAAGVEVSFETGFGPLRTDL
jgi:hypothetical protein